MEGASILDFVIHFADRYLVVGVWFYFSGGSWGFHWNSNIASVGGLFFRGLLGIWGVGVWSGSDDI